jgi:hypothetical protein
MVNGRSDYSAVVDAFGPLYSKCGACLLSIMPSWTSEHFDSTVWGIWATVSLHRLSAMRKPERLTVAG